MSYVVKPEEVSIHCYPRVHGVCNDSRCISIQVIVNKLTIMYICQSINIFYDLASLELKVNELK